jgi:ankyrin repeat protein
MKSKQIKSIIYLFLLFIITGCNGQRIQKSEILKQLIKKNDYEGFIKELNNLKDINAFNLEEDNANYTLIGYSCKYKRKKIVEELVNRRADIALGKEDEFYTYDALYVSIENQDPAVVNFLLSKKTNINAIYSEDGLNPMLLACQKNNLEIVKSLVKYGAKINGDPDLKSSNPILTATINNNYKIVEFLVENGADPNISIKENISALDYAKKNNYKIYQLFVSSHSKMTKNSSLDLKTLEDLKTDLHKIKVNVKCDLNMDGKEDMIVLFEPNNLNKYKGSSNHIEESYLYIMINNGKNKFYTNSNSNAVYTSINPLLFNCPIEGLIKLSADKSFFTIEQKSCDRDFDSNEIYSITFKYDSKKNEIKLYSYVKKTYERKDNSEMLLHSKILHSSDFGDILFEDFRIQKDYYTKR